MKESTLTKYWDNHRLKMWTGWTRAMYNLTSLKWWGFEQEYVGNDFVVQPGYEKLISWSVNEMERMGRQIKLDEEVTDVIWNENSSSEGEQVKVITKKKNHYSADYVISTLSLGVMKYRSPHFKPLLSKRKLESIANLGMGLLNKIVLTYNEPWWKSETAASWFAILPSTIASESDNYALPQEAIPKTKADAEWLLQNNGLFFQDYTTITGSNTLVCFLGPPTAHAQELLDDEYVVKTVHQRVVESLLPQSKRQDASLPIDSFVTRWNSDPYILTFLHLLTIRLVVVQRTCLSSLDLFGTVNWALLVSTHM